MTEDYPAFVAWYRLLDWILDRCEGFPKSVRFTISGRIANLSLDILQRLIEAIYTKQRADILGTINVYIEQLRVLFRLSFERKYLSASQYEYVATELEGFGRMIGGWKKQCDG